MNSRILIIFIILITIGIGGFFVYKYLLVEKEEGPIDRVNQNIPPYLLYQSKSQEIPEEYLLVENQKLDTELIYQKTRRLEFTGKNKLYCKPSGEEAEKIEYFYHSLGPDWEGGWYYRDAYICGDNYWILDADGRFGTKIYGPFEKTVSSEEGKVEGEISCKDSLDCPSQMKCENSVCVDVGCVEEGHRLPRVAISPEGFESREHMATECCAGLTGISHRDDFDENCDLKPSGEGVIGRGSVCSKSGNGICEEWETKCNCPKDCKEFQKSIFQEIWEKILNFFK